MDEPPLAEVGPGAEPERVKILLVDDNPDNLLALEAVLQRPDYELVRATSGEEALKRVLHDEFALILLDVAMPILDGFQTAALIRQRRKARRIPIIFVSAMMQEVAHVFEGYEVGAVDYLLKPFDSHALSAKVKVFVELYRQGRELERQERALRRLERRERLQLESLYDVTFEEAPVGIGHASVTGRWMRVNQRLLDIAGRPREEILRLTLPEIVVTQDRGSILEDIHAILSGQAQKRHGEYRFLRADGSTVWTALTLSLLRDRDRKPVQLTIVEDITEEKRLAASLEAAEARFARLSESGLIGIVYERADGVVLDANEAFLSMIGRSRDELEAGQIHMRELTPPEYDEADGHARAELRDHGIARPYEKELVRADGGRTAVLVGCAAFAPPDQGVIGFAVDVTDRKHIEQERARVVRELRDAVRARDDFLSLAAHELRTPLTPLVMQISNLLSLAREHKVPSDADWLVKQVEPIDRALNRLRRLVGTLLDASRAVGELRLERVELDLANLVREIVERTRGDMERAGCDVTVRTESVVGRWDRTHLEQLVGNLLSNAMKYGARKPIEVDVEQDAGLARLSVRDHGIGIAPEDQQRIFERFERLVPVRHYGGLGVGLWIVRQIVLAHGGRTWVESTPGEGARFVVELPR